MLECSFKLDPAKTPKAIDLTIDFISILVPDTKEAQKSLKKMNGKAILGIYGLKQDTLMCFFSDVAGSGPGGSQ